MAIQQQQQTGHPQNQPLLHFDALYCEEEQPQWEEDDDIGVVELGGPETACVVDIHINNNGGTGTETTDNVPFPLLPNYLLLLSEQDLLIWDEEEEEELVSLFSKEHEQIQYPNGGPDMDPALILVRKEAVEWMLKVVAFYGFTALTSILAINYLDRFLSSVHFQRDKPWMVQLSAVTCLSLAAKVEETQVPLLLDLQVVEDTKYMFEAKTIQRMELVVLSALKWRMNLVTPLSFLDHIVRRRRRLRLKKTHLQWEFLRRCERLIVSVVADWRSVCFVPSVLATAAMLHVVHQQQQQQQVDPLNAIDYQTQLLRLLNITQEEEEEVEKVKDCYQLITEVVSSLSSNGNVENMKQSNNNKKKRKYNDGNPESPNGVIDLSLVVSYDDTTSSNEDDFYESWAMADGGTSPRGPSVSSSPEPLPPIFKKIRSTDQF